MIEIQNIFYIAEIDETRFEYIFTHNDYRLSSIDQFKGELSEDEIKEKMQSEYDAWIERLG